MKKVFKGVSFLSLVLITALVLQYVDLKNIQDALAQSSNPRIVRPAEKGIEALERIFVAETPTTMRSTSANYALPQEEIYQSVQYHTGTSHIKWAPIQMDLNSDGLQDLVYSRYQENYYPLGGHQYVMLNNGNGFELVYGCIMTRVDLVQAIKYKGDCADHS